MNTVKMIFDTNCVLCSGFVRFILRHERDDDIIFVNAWSKAGLSLAEEYGLDEAALNQTYLVISGDKGLTKSDAGMAILSHLKAPWRWLRVLRFVPRRLRDLIYSLVAKRRYKWFGYKENCLIPTADILHRFIDV